MTDLLAPAADPRAPETAPGYWDRYTYWSDGVTQWGAKTWPAGAGWHDAWRWWYQYDDQTQPAWDLTELVVEARWTTDSHTLGDGTLHRGDLQPGRLELQLHDPTGKVRGLR